MLDSTLQRHKQLRFAEKKISQFFHIFVCLRIFFFLKLFRLSFLWSQNSDYISPIQIPNPTIPTCIYSMIRNKINSLKCNKMYINTWDQLSKDNPTHTGYMEPKGTHLKSSVMQNHLMIWYRYGLSRSKKIAKTSKETQNSASRANIPLKIGLVRVK